MRSWWYYFVKKIVYVIVLGMLLFGVINTCLN